MNAENPSQPARSVSERTKKPTAYLPFYGNDFFQSMSGYSKAVVVGYLRALWHYWGHTGCEGLADDDDYLRRICDCQADEWERIKAIIFDNRYHFRLEDGLWQQGRCRDEFNKSRKIYTARVEAGRRAVSGRRSNTPIANG